jgi:NADPH:quinone reductase-like Zn-dependent oxidoreductase
MTLLQLTRAAGYSGRIAVTSHSKPDREDLLAHGADIVLEPFQDAADRAVDILTGGEQLERTSIPAIAADEESTQ